MSFGNAKTQRRLEYVANGQANTDAVNMSQLHQQIEQTHTYTRQQKAAITQQKLTSHNKILPRYTAQKCILITNQ